MYTVRNCSFDDISCDNNGAYINSDIVKRDFFVKITDSKVTAKKVHLVNGKFFYKEQKSRTYVDKFVDKKDVFLIERYYHQNKSITQLKRMIVRIKNHLHFNYEPYACVVYSLSCDEEGIENAQVLEHGNSRGDVSLKRPYIRTNKRILSREDELLRTKKRPAEVYDVLLKESGGPFQSRSLSSEPRDTKQILNRQAML